MKKAVVSAFLHIAGVLLLATAAGAQGTGAASALSHPPPENGAAPAAQDIGAARAAYAEGRFVEAAELGEASGTSEGYALAAESLAIHGHYISGEAERPDVLARAIRAAEEAVRLDPGNPEAHFQSAHAIGREAQTVSVVEALNRGYARRTRQAAEEALRLDPDMAEAHVTLASWHAEIVNKMGRLVAGMTYRATRRDALEHYEKALELASGEKAVYLEYANGLLLLNRNRARERARELLSQGIDIRPEDAYDRILHDLSVQRLAALDGA